MKKQLFLSLMIFYFTSQLYAQVKVINGQVYSSADNSPLPGATITIPGTTKGSVTDINGNYSISAAEGDTLVFSFFGMEEEKMLVGTKSVIDVYLDEATIDMEELVVIGYGVRKKRDLIGSVAVINTEELEKIPVNNIENALQGMASGVMANSSDGVPGSRVNVVIRGQSSVNLSVEPLWIIDGVPVYNGSGLDRRSSTSTQSPLSLINPNDIESIQVLKDAAATAIYGSRGSNGVILITTKRGTKGQGKVDVSYKRGVSFLSYDASENYATTAEWFDIMDRATANYYGIDSVNFDTKLHFVAPSGFDSVPTREEALMTNTDWFDEILQTGTYDEFNISTSGGNDDASYFISANYRDDAGVLKTNHLKRYSSRINLNYKPKEKLDVGVNISISYTDNDRVRNQGNSGGYGAANRVSLPWYKIRNEEDQYLNTFSRTNLTAYLDEDLYANKVEQFRVLGNLYTEYKIPFIEGLALRGEAGLDYLTVSSFEKLDPIINGGVSEGFDRTSTRPGTNWNAFLKYYKTFNEIHAVSSEAGIEGTASYVYEKNMTGRELSGNLPELREPLEFYAMDANIKNEKYFFGYFGRVDYKLMDKYFLGISFRRDGISQLDESHRWGFFPSISAGWVISDEAFFKPVSVVNFLKVRGSVGQTGNSDVPATAIYTPYNTDDSHRYTGYNIAKVPQKPGNPDLKWETTTSWDGGVDFGIIENRISGSVAYYYQNIEDLIIDISIPVSSGYNNNEITFNTGHVANRGIELNLSSVNIHNPFNGFKWTTNVNFTTNKNEILSIEKEFDEDFGYLTASSGRPTGTIMIKGESMSTFYMPEYAGIDPQTGIEMIYELDVDEYLVDENDNYIDGSGNILPPDADPVRNPDYLEKTGELIPATVANVQQHKFIHSGKTANPTYFGGLINTFEYKGFDFSFSFTFTGGHYIYDYNAQRASYPYQGNTMLYDDLLEKSWQQSGDSDAEYPYLMLYGKMNGYWNGESIDTTGSVSSYSIYEIQSGGVHSKYLYRGDYIRLKNIQLGYNLPSNWVNKIKINNLRLYVNISNLWTYAADYKHFDPEGGAYRDTYGLPQTRTYTFGINLTL